MKTALLAILMIFIFCTQTTAKELFSARCVAALTGYSWSWSVEENGGKLNISYATLPKKYNSGERNNYITQMIGANADALRAQVASLRLTQNDVKFLQTQEIIELDSSSGKEVVVLAPFDGVDYYFNITMPDGSREIKIGNPKFYLKYFSTTEEAKRVKEVLDLLEKLTSVAKNEGDSKRSGLTREFKVEHQYSWHEFTLKKPLLLSDDSHYRLKAVRRNGDVELIDVSEDSPNKVVVVKPWPKKIKVGDKPPDIIVVTSNYKEQSATIRELRLDTCNMIIHAVSEEPPKD